MDRYSRIYSPPPCPPCRGNTRLRNRSCLFFPQHKRLTSFFIGMPGSSAHCHKETHRITHTRNTHKKHFNPQEPNCQHHNKIHRTSSWEAIITYRTTTTEIHTASGRRHGSTRNNVNAWVRHSKACCVFSTEKIRLLVRKVEQTRNVTERSPYLLFAIYQKKHAGSPCR